MTEIRSIAQGYPLRNIYNMDESGLFYRMCPRMSYLSPDEKRKEVRGTELQRHKSRLTIVLCVYGDGSHPVPVKYIGSASHPRCFRDSRFAYLKV